MTGRPKRPKAACTHNQPQKFNAGKSVELEISVNATPKSIKLYYRHVDQAERFESIEMNMKGNKFTATIPVEYTITPFPIQYYFEIKNTQESVWMHPGFNADQTNQPYFVIRKV